jgi:hypothetical protein
VLSRARLCLTGKLEVPPRVAPSFTGIGLIPAGAVGRNLDSRALGMDLDEAISMKPQAMGTNGPRYWMNAGRRTVMSRLFLGALILGSLLVFAAAARADESDDFHADANSPVNQSRPPAHDESWYYHPAPEPAAYKPNPQQICQQRAMAYGQQRSNRLAALSWYGMSNARPTVAPLPYCVPLYSPAWESPYRAGFSWRQGAATYIVSGRPTYTVR